jgi:hypothetical protein
MDSVRFGAGDAYRICGTLRAIVGGSAPQRVQTRYTRQRVNTFLGADFPLLGKRI